MATVAAGVIGLQITKVMKEQASGLRLRTLGFGLGFSDCEFVGHGERTPPEILRPEACFQAVADFP